MALVTQSEYARHRGVSRQAVSRAVADGRVRTVRGRIDAAEADRDWPRVAEPLAETPDDLPLSELRRQRALLDLKAAHLEYLRKASALVEVAGIERALFAASRAMRDKLLALPTRIVPGTAGLDTREAILVWERALIDVLRDFSESADNGVNSAKEREAAR